MAGIDAVLEKRFFHQVQAGPVANAAIVGTSDGTAWTKRTVPFLDQENVWASQRINGNLRIGTDSTGGMSRGIALIDDPSPPGSNPAGGTALYSGAGLLRQRSSGGDLGVMAAEGRANVFTQNQRTTGRWETDMAAVDTGKIMLKANKIGGQPIDANWVVKAGTNPAGGEARHNIVSGWGTNLNENFQRENNAWGLACWCIEGSWFQGGHWLYETQWRVIPSDGLVQLRPNAIYVRDTAPDYFTEHINQASEVSYTNPAQNFDVASAWFKITQAGVGEADGILWKKLNTKQIRIPAPTGGVVWNEIEWVGFGDYAPAAGGYGFNVDVRDSGAGTFDWIFRSRHSATGFTDREKWTSNGQKYTVQSRFGSLATSDFTSLVSTTGAAVGLAHSLEFVNRTSGSGSGHRFRNSDNGSQGELLLERRNNSGSFTTMGRFRSDGRNCLDVLHLGSATASTYDNALVTAGLVIGTSGSFEHLLFNTNPAYAIRMGPVDSGLGHTNGNLYARSGSGSWTTAFRWNPLYNMFQCRNAVPSSSYIGQNEIIPYSDETNNLIKVKACRNDGTTIQTGILADLLGDYIPLKFSVDNGSTVLATGQQVATQYIPFACTIAGWVIMGSPSGSVSLIVEKATASGSGYSAWSAISGTEKPALSSAERASDLTLTTWTTALAAGDYLRINVESATTVTHVDLLIIVRRT